MASKPFDFLKIANDWLEEVPGRIITAFDNYIGNGEKAVQSKVDVVCEWLAWKVNIAVERKRQWLLKVLYEQYKSTAGGRVMQMATVAQKFVKDPLGALASFASALFAPVASIIDWTMMLMVELPRLAANLANIVQSLPPSPPNPQINYDKFKLKIGSISMSAIATDPSTLPAPEVLFPEPEKPFSKDSFQKAFSDSSATLKSSSVKYKLSEEETKSLSDYIKDEVNTSFDGYDAI